MKIIALLLLVLTTGCASTGPVIKKQADGSVTFENRSYTVGPAQLTGASNDFNGAYEIKPDGTVVIMIQSGQAVESASSESPIKDITELISVVKTP